MSRDFRYYVTFSKAIFDIMLVICFSIILKLLSFFLAPLASDLDLKPSLLSDGDSGSYGPLTASSKQYMSVLRKNYFV